MKRSLGIAFDLVQAHTVCSFASFWKKDFLAIPNMHYRFPASMNTTKLPDGMFASVLVLTIHWLPIFGTNARVRIYKHTVRSSRSSLV